MERKLQQLRDRGKGDVADRLVDEMIRVSSEASSFDERWEAEKRSWIVALQAAQDELRRVS